MVDRRYSTNDLRSSILNLRCSIIGLRSSTCNLRSAIFDLALRYSILALRFSTCDLRSVFALPFSIFALRFSINELRFSIFDLRFAVVGSRSSNFPLPARRTSENPTNFTSTAAGFSADFLPGGRAQYPDRRRETPKVTSHRKHRRRKAVMRRTSTSADGIDDGDDDVNATPIRGSKVSSENATRPDDVPGLVRPRGGP